MYLQRTGVCVKSSVASVFSDLYLASMDRVLTERLQHTDVSRVFRLVDDYVVPFNTEHAQLEAEFNDVLNIFRECIAPLVVTCEMPQDACIRFLDLKLILEPEHVCWSYEPRTGKPLLPFDSVHSKLVKTALVRACFTNVLC